MLPKTDVHQSLPSYPDTTLKVLPIGESHVVSGGVCTIEIQSARMTYLNGGRRSEAESELGSVDWALQMNKIRRLSIVVLL